jgi:alpha-tubulin suppressor-like RCC1 family protein
LNTTYHSVTDENKVFFYKNLSAFVASDSPEKIWLIPTKGIAQLVANETAFSVLDVEGKVYTWGDPRHGLGREVTADEPADVPVVVQALEGIRVTKISSMGWLTAALTEPRDLYIWGHTGPNVVGGGRDAIDFLPENTEDVGLVDLGAEVEVVDVAVGAGHVCALTISGDIYTAGRNESGQAGVVDSENFQRNWKKWGKVWDGDIRAVFSGWESSFCVVSST